MIRLITILFGREEKRRGEEKGKEEEKKKEGGRESRGEEKREMTVNQTEKRSSLLF